ncbi:MAG: cbb3-type cytochrome c oxidase subunit I, partial [Myxococcota bacterium]
MTPTIAQLLALSFMTAVVGLLALIWSIARHQFSRLEEASRVIFRPGEEGYAEDPTAQRELLQASVSSDLVQTQTSSPADIQARFDADRSSRWPVLLFTASAIFWLVVGSTAGLVVSLKFNLPDWLSATPALTFGRLRPVHLNAVAYGWLSMAGMATSLWLLPRTLRTTLRGARFAVAGAILWNIGMVTGLVALMYGWTDGTEWLEFPWPLDGFFVVGGGLTGVPLLLTLRHRQVEHLYVSTWYIAAALVWFPILFAVGNWPGVHFGVEHALVNWWYAHNVLGLWFTPLGLAAAYYLIPKIVGRP